VKKKGILTMTTNNQLSTREQYPAGRNEEYSVLPLADVHETPDAFVVQLDMPGATREGIAVSIDRGELTVRGSVQPFHGEGSSLIYRELRPATYRRVFTIGRDVDAGSVDAVYEDGVLTLKLLKREEVRPKEIIVR
jgi:HSP20 family molecular chaperone IbpA